MKRRRRSERRPLTGSRTEANDEGRLSEEGPSPERAREQTMSRALKLLATRPRTEAEIRARLASSHAKPDVIESCISHLKELSLIDDRRYAEGFARSRLRAEPTGRQRLASQLAAKSISRRTIDEALNEIFDEEGEEELLVRAIQKHVRLHGRPQDRAAAKRLFDHLARRGFDYELIRQKLRSVTRELEEDGEA